MALAFAAIITLFATLFNPWGIYMWAYVKRLWSAPHNDLLSEISCFDITSITHPLTICFWIITITYLFLFLRKIYLHRSIEFLSPILSIIGLYAGLKHQALLPITILFIFAAITEISAIRNKNLENQHKSSFWQSIENHLQRIVPKPSRSLPVFLIFALSGSLAYGTLDPPTLPKSKSFKAPFAAIEYLKHSQPKGNVFNDPLFGSLMTWYLPKVNIFFDSRFSQYDPERMADYLHINNCDLGYEKIWHKYNFHWVFIQATSPLHKL